MFDIQQGVSVNIFIKTGKKKINELGTVNHYDLYGNREKKYYFLTKHSLSSIDYKRIRPLEPTFFFAQKDTSKLSVYKNGFSTSELFLIQSMGITSARDSFVIDFNKDLLEKRIIDFANPDLDDSIIREKYFGSKKSGKYLKGDTRGWKMSEARVSISNNNHSKYFLPISYRPFDIRTIYYSSIMVDWGREEVMSHLKENNNIALCMVKVGRDANAHNYFLTNRITDKSISSSLDNANVFPLYIYSKTKDQQHLDPSTTRTPNLNKEIVDEIAQNLGLHFTPEKEDTEGTFAPIDILDYIYAVLHSPTYREKFKEFLKIDFPRVPYPEDQEKFWQLVKLGGELRQIHMLESPKVEQRITTYPQSGSNLVEKLRYDIADDADTGRVWINTAQYFDGVPKVAWEFYIGGYQPAQKWLKDRKGRELSFEDILHYQKIVVALVETDRLMKEVDRTGAQHQGHT